MAKESTGHTSPMTWSFPDYMGRAISLRVTFNERTRRITGATVTRDTGCLYSTLYWGLGEDGTPDTTTRKATVPEGTTTLGSGQITALGFTYVENIEAVNFTAGP